MKSILSLALLSLLLLPSSSYADSPCDEYQKSYCALTSAISDSATSMLIKFEIPKDDSRPLKERIKTDLKKLVILYGLNDTNGPITLDKSRDLYYKCQNSTDPKRFEVTNEDSVVARIGFAVIVTDAEIKLGDPVDRLKTQHLPELQILLPSLNELISTSLSTNKCK